MRLALRVALFLFLLVLFANMNLWATGAANVQSRIQEIRWKIENRRDVNLEIRYENGNLKEKYNRDGKEVLYSSFFPNGKMQERYVHRKTGEIDYERYYGKGRIAEGFFEDDRGVTYTSYHDNGRAREQYYRNKRTRKIDYYRYSREGKLIR